MSKDPEVFNRFDEIEDDIADKILSKEIELDFKGHFGNNEITSKNDIFFILERIHTFIILSDQFEKIYFSIDPVEYVFQEEEKMFSTHTCHVCGKQIKLFIKGKKIFIKEECEFKEGFPEIEVEIDVPSGMLILYNDLRHFYPEYDSLRRDINTLNGERLYSMDYAKLGMISIFIGNTSPNIYQVNDSHLIIGCDYSEERGCDSIKGEVVGAICTDLWWYCAVDKDGFEKKSQMSLDDFDKTLEKKGHWTRLNRVKVKPGRYKATGRYHLTEYKEDSAEIFSEITLIK